MKQYDAESVYDESIAPLMAQILQICKQHEIPMLATFQLNNASTDPHGEGSDLWCTSLMAQYEHGDNDRLMRGHRELNRKKSYSVLITATNGGAA